MYEQNNEIKICKPMIDKLLIDKLISFEYVNNEIPSHSIILKNIPIETTEEEIIYISKEFGEYKKINFDDLKKGIVEVLFYNLKDSMLMRASSIFIKQHSIFIKFGKDLIPIDKKRPQNNGTIVVFNLPKNIEDCEIYSIFQKFGEIKEIRETPYKNSQRFIEYYDLRNAAKAKRKTKMKKLNIKGNICILNVEFSIVGNYKYQYQNTYNKYIPEIQLNIDSQICLKKR